MARVAGVRILINSDAHAPGELTAGFPEAITAVKAAGFTETLRYVKRAAHPVPLP
jgi:histidinol-phosphatase (PHP family)